MTPVLSALTNAPNHYRIHLLHGTNKGERLHVHDCYQILYVLEGQMLHGDLEHQVVLEPGTAFLVPPGHAHRTSAVAHRELTYYSVSFRQALFSPGFVASPVHDFLSTLRVRAILDQEADVRLRVRLSEPEQKQAQRLLEGLMEEYESRWDAENTMASHLVAGLLRILARSYAAVRKEPKEDPIAACIRFLDNNYRLDLTLEELARRFALSRSALVRQFAERTGVSVKRYLHQKRIQQAGKLCGVPEIPIREIANLVGYQEVSTFYRNFVKFFGVSPAAYRVEVLGKKEIENPE